MRRQKPQATWRPKETTTSNHSVEKRESKPKETSNGSIEDKRQQNSRQTASSTQNRSVDQFDRPRRSRSYGQHSSRPSYESSSLNRDNSPKKSSKKQKRKEDKSSSSQSQNQKKAKSRKSPSKETDEDSTRSKNGRSSRVDHNSEFYGDDSTRPRERKRDKNGKDRDVEEERSGERSNRESRGDSRGDDRRRLRDDRQFDGSRGNRPFDYGYDFPRNRRPRRRTQPSFYQHDVRWDTEHVRRNGRDSYGRRPRSGRHRPYDETPVEVEYKHHDRTEDEGHIPSSSIAQSDGASTQPSHPIQPSPDKSLEDPHDSQISSHDVPLDHDRNNAIDSSADKNMNGFSNNGNDKDGDELVRSEEAGIQSEADVALDTAVFSLDDLDQQLRALDIVLSGLIKMHETELVSRMQEYRDKLANSLNTQVIPQSIDSFQEISSMARSDDGPDYIGDRVGPTRPPMKTFRRRVPQVNAPQPMSGSSRRRKPPKTSSRSDVRRFEIFGPAGWYEYQSQLTPQETSDVSISPDVQHRGQTRTSTTGMNTDVSQGVQKQQNGRAVRPPTGYDGMRPMFSGYQGGAQPPLIQHSGSFGDLRLASHQYISPGVHPFPSTGLSGVTTTGQSTPSSSVPLVMGPPGIGFNPDGRMPVFPQYIGNGSSAHMNLPVLNMGDYSQPNMLLPTPSSMPNQTPRRSGDGTYDPTRQHLVALSVRADKSDKELYFYSGDNVREVARKFCVNHNILNHAGSVENELRRALRENHPNQYHA